MTQEDSGNANRPDKLETVFTPNPPVSSSTAAPAGNPGLPPGSLVAGHFRIVRLLGRGGMGEVYLAEDTRLERQVALKRLPPGLAIDPGSRQRFLREARAASSLSHPHICVVHEVGEAEDGCPFFAMELLQGEALDARAARGPLAIGEVVEIALQVAEALQAAHARGIVHRDIKPANVSLGADGQVKVLDFGLAKSLPGVAGAVPLDSTGAVTTQVGTLLGTPYYMSPEQALGREVDHRSDLFSLGAVIYELVTRRPPFPGSSMGEVINKVVHEQPDAMARFNYNLPVELERVVRKCLEKSLDRRYQSARDLCVDLRNLRRDLERDARTGVADAETAPVEARAVEDLSKSDIFLSYASVDDQPVVTGRQGWITQLQRNLKVRLEQLSGDEVRIWPQANPLGSGVGPVEVIQQLSAVKTLVSVLSPPFVRSEGCRSQVATFWREAEQRGLLEVESRSRVFKVVKTPVEAHELPADVGPLMARLKSFEFFEIDPETGRLREFDEAFGELWRQRYHERVYDVAHELSQVLRNLQARGSALRPPLPDAKVIYLAATTADLQAQRDQLQRELVALGHTVVPDRQLPYVAADLESAVRGYLEESDFAVHLIGDRYGFVPEDSDLSVVALQNRLAAEASATRKLQRFLWLPRGLQPRDARQEAFLRELVRDPEAHRGGEVVSDTLEGFKHLVEEACRPRPAPVSARQSAAGGEQPSRVYLICDAADEAAIEALEDFFHEQGFEVSLPGFDAAESEFQEIHIRNLQDCDAALIYYGAAGRSWVDFKVRDLSKAAGYRDSRPIAVAAVYVAPPMDRRKERFRTVSVDRIQQHGERFEPGVLAGFTAKIVEARRK